ncbi:MAG: phosphopentomutase [Bacillota bacterium]|jgi:phosphopentomutase
MAENKRVIILLMDSAGCGSAPDAAAFGDEGCNTLGHICEKFEAVQLPNLAKLGLGKIGSFKNVVSPRKVMGSYGKMQEVSQGKDTTCGHWEIAGTPVMAPLPTYPNGFPEDIMAEFTQITGRGFLGNEVASGTEIINRLGDEHVRTGKVIVYTSADSVFQIAAHEAVVPLSELYDICRKARKILVGSNGVGRVIARPFVGENGKYVRTVNRRDFSLLPPPGQIFDNLQKAGIPTVAVGKIHDIFAEQGIDYSYPTQNNADGMDKTLTALEKHRSGFIWTNLVDFDMQFGHRNDWEGYGRALEAFDAWLPRLLARMLDEDMLIITADHGNDPTTTGTDHSREYVPLLVYGKNLQGDVDLGIRQTFADVGATVAEYLGCNPVPTGESFFKLIKK